MPFSQEKERFSLTKQSLPATHRVPAKAGRASAQQQPGAGAHLRGGALQQHRVQGDGGEHARFASAGLGLHDEIWKEPPQRSPEAPGCPPLPAAPRPARPLTQAAAPQRDGLQLDRRRPVEPSRLQPRQHRRRQQQRPEVGRAAGHQHVARTEPSLSRRRRRRVRGRRHLTGGAGGKKAAEGGALARRAMSRAAHAHWANTPPRSPSAPRAARGRRGRRLAGGGRAGPPVCGRRAGAAGLLRRLTRFFWIFFYRH